MPATTLTRPPPTYTSHIHVRSAQQPLHGRGGGGGGGGGAAPGGRKKKRKGRKKDPPPLVQKVGLAAQIYSLQGLMETMLWFQGWREWFYPPDGGPNIVKAYEARPGMAVRIFFPASYDLTSPQTLPTVLTIHGGGFCLGTARDDDEWNRAFSDAQNMLVVSLPYSKAPRALFPAGLHDLEALYLAVLGDESLPIDRTSSKGGTPGRVALLGHDAGGNLALALSQLPKVRRCATPPTATLSVGGYLDLERPAADKARNRPTRLTTTTTGGLAADPLVATHDAYAWGYVPYGHDLRDPLLSPAFATWPDDDDGGGRVGAAGLPPHVCLVAAELDILAHESWRLACRLVRDGGVQRGDGRAARWRVPDPDAADDLERVCGRDAAAAPGSQLELSDLGLSAIPNNREDGMSASKRFGFEVRWDGVGAGAGAGEGSVKWILVPDALHGFDRAPAPRAEAHEYVGAVGKWLRETAWGV